MRVRAGPLRAPLLPGPPAVQHIGPNTPSSVVGGKPSDWLTSADPDELRSSREKYDASAAWPEACRPVSSIVEVAQSRELFLRTVFVTEQRGPSSSYFPDASVLEAGTHRNSGRITRSLASPELVLGRYLTLPKLPLIPDSVADEMFALAVEPEVSRASPERAGQRLDGDAVRASPSARPRFARRQPHRFLHAGSADRPAPGSGAVEHGRRGFEREHRGRRRRGTVVATLFSDLMALFVSSA